MKFVQISAVFSLLTGLLAGFSASVATANDSAGQVRRIQGYAQGCSTYLANGTPVVRINLYRTGAEAFASKTSVVRPQTDVVLDYGPGYTVLSLNRESQTLLICVAIKAQNAEKPVLIETNSNNVVVSVQAYGQKLDSDAYALMSPSDQKRIETLTKAYIAEGWKIYDLEEKLRTLNSKPVKTK